MQKDQIVDNLQKLKEKKNEAIKFQIEKCRNDKYYWLTNFAYTLDPHDKKTPVKLFPKLDYLREIIKVDEAEDLLLLEKSRQMLMTWLFIALCVHEIQFNVGRHVFIQSKKQDDANVLLDRAKHIYTNQPDWLKPELNPTDTFLKLKIKCNKSLIMGIPEGGDQIRTHTASRIFSDEMAFQPEAEDAYTASLPCIKGGGKFVGVSTANPTFFYELTGEKAETTEIMTGLKIKHTPKGNCVLSLHYTADPRKRTKEWKDAEMLGFRTEDGGTDARWKKEYEIDYEATGGTLVYPELHEEFKGIYIKPFKIPIWWKRYGSIDPGPQAPTSVHYYAVDDIGRVFVYWELYEKKLHYLQLCRILEGHEDYKGINRRGFMIDPEAVKQNQQSKFGITSFKELLEGEGMNVFTGNRDKILGAEQIRALIRQGKFFIFNTCPKMWWELNKLRYEEWKGATKAERNVKETIIRKDDHAWSELRYFVLSAYSKSKKPLDKDSLEARIKKMHKKSKIDFNKIYSVE